MKKNLNEENNNLLESTRISLFKGKQIRKTLFQGEWWFSVVDVVGVLTESVDPRKYWSVLKTRLKKEGNELTTNCSQLKMQSSDGKMYLTDLSNTECIFRIVHRIVSHFAIPLKQYLHKKRNESVTFCHGLKLEVIDRS